MGPRTKVVNQVTRRYLIRVCKKWQRLALLYLYEWILVRRVKHLQRIVHAIERSLSGATRVCVGWCTKRLDIDLRWTEGETDDQMAQVGPFLLRLLRGLPNLEVLTIGGCYDHSWINPSVSHTYCPKLQVLNWVNDANVLDPEVWAHFISSHLSLLGINPSATTPPDRQPSSFTHTLLNWTTGYISPVPITSTFTSLQRLNLNLHTLFIADPIWYEHFITSPLPSVTTLQLNFVNYHGLVDLNIDLNTIHPLFRFLPSLQRVDLVLPVWPQVWSGYVFPPTVQVLGVRVCSVKPKRQLVRWWLQILGHVVREAHESLKVQFLDEKTMEDVLVHKEYVVKYAREWNVLEWWLDPDGEIYKLPI